VFAVWQSRRETCGGAGGVRREFGGPHRPGWKGTSVDLLLIVGGFVLLVVGSRWLVDGAVLGARALGVSELVVGLTIVAAGTSLPEVAASVVAALRGERDIAVGNVVGSSLFNILSVLGVTSLVAPGGACAWPTPRSASTSR
jgi:cation:H+ antiporter